MAAILNNSPLVYMTDTTITCGGKVISIAHTSWSTLGSRLAN